MKARRIVPLGLAVAALLALAGLASHGRPLAGGRGSGPTATFFDYVATTLVLGALAMLAVVLYTIFDFERSGGGPPRRGRWNLLSMFATFAGAAVVVFLLIHSGYIERMRRLEQQLLKNQPAQTGGQQNRKTPAQGRNAQLRWDEIGVFLALIAGTAVVLFATRTTKRPPRRLWRLGREDAVSAAIDESIDDLRTDPDLRRAIVAAYARMEQALARAGLPRHPAEAPFEYVDRALRSLDTSAASVERLTGLFEWAKFSQHEPRAEMRDEAIDALVAVRDELTRHSEEAVPA